jgi:hypothetical protein
MFSLPGVFGEGSGRVDLALVAQDGAALPLQPRKSHDPMIVIIVKISSFLVNS